MATSTDEIYVKIITDIQDSVAKLQAHVLQIFSVVAAYETLKKVLIDSFKAYMDEEVSIVRMNEALKISGQYSTAASADMENLAKQLMRTTVYADETARAAEGILMQLGNLSVYGVQKLMPLIADFASSMGLDLVQAAELVGKTLGGTTNMLGRYGIQLGDLKDPQERFNKLVEQMTTKFQGMSQELANTTDGQLKQLKNNIDELAKSLGLVIAELMNPILTGVNTTFKIGAIMQVDPRTITDMATVTSMIQTLSTYLGNMRGPTEHISAQELDNEREQLRLLMAAQTRIQDQLDHAPPTPFNDSGEAAALAKAWADLAATMNTDAMKLYWQMSRGGMPPVGVPYPAGGNLNLGGNVGVVGAASSQGMSNLNLGGNVGVPSGLSASELADMARQSQILAQQMQQVADAAIQFGTSLAKGDIQGAFATLGMQIAKLLVSYALTAAASAATAQNWGVMAFWLGVAGVGAIAEIGMGSSAGATSGSSLPTTLPTSGKIVNVNIGGSVIAERDLARTMVASMRDW